MAVPVVATDSVIIDAANQPDVSTKQGERSGPWVYGSALYLVLFDSNSGFPFNDIPLLVYKSTDDGVTWSSSSGPRARGNLNFDCCFDASAGRIYIVRRTPLTTGVDSVVTFDCVTDTWSATIGPDFAANNAVRCDVLPDGRVFIASLDQSSSPRNSCYWLYDPAGNTMSGPTALMPRIGTASQVIISQCTDAAGNVYTVVQDTSGGSPVPDANGWYVVQTTAAGVVSAATLVQSFGVSQSVVRSSNVVGGVPVVLAGSLLVPIVYRHNTNGNPDTVQVAIWSGSIGGTFTPSAVLDQSTSLFNIASCSLVLGSGGVVAVWTNGAYPPTMAVLVSSSADGVTWDAAATFYDAAVPGPGMAAAIDNHLESVSGAYLSDGRFVALFSGTDETFFSTQWVAVEPGGAESDGVYARFRWPDGVFSASAPILCDYYGLGRLMYWQDGPVWCGARSLIGYEIVNESSEAQAVTILLAGIQRVYEGAAAAPAGELCGFPVDPRPFTDRPFVLVHGTTVAALATITDGLISTREHPFRVCGISILLAEV